MAKRQSYRYETDDEEFFVMKWRGEEDADRFVSEVSFNRSIAFTGLEQASFETQKEAVALAEAVGAWVVRVAEFEGDRSPWAVALAQKGVTAASWSEIRQRSDALLLWYAPLWETHPRWVDRFGPRSNRAHRVAVVSHDCDIRHSGWIEDQIVRVDPARACEFLRSVRAATLDNSIEPADAETRKVVHLIRNAHWLAVVRSEDPPGLTDPHGTAEAFSDLIAAANADGSRRVVTTHVPQAINEAGLDAILSMRAGLTTPLRFTPEGPVRESGEWSADDIDLVVRFYAYSSVRDMVAEREFRERRAANAKSVRGKRQSWIEVPLLEDDAKSAGTMIRADGVAIPVRGFEPERMPGLAQSLRIVRETVLQSLAVPDKFEEPGLPNSNQPPGAVP